MKFLKRSLLLFSYIALSLSAAASESDQVNALETEINYLLTFIAASNCKFIRNGDTHTIEEALEHIQRKYDYYQDDIITTEDFIELSASKSTFSGKPYYVLCDGERQKSEDWLKDALNLFRTKNK